MKEYLVLITEKEEWYEVVLERKENISSTPVA